MAEGGSSKALEWAVKELWCQGAEGRGPGLRVSCYHERARAGRLLPMNHAGRILCHNLAALNFLPQAEPLLTGLHLSCHHISRLHASPAYSRCLLPPVGPSPCAPAATWRHSTGCAPAAWRYAASLGHAGGLLSATLSTQQKQPQQQGHGSGACNIINALRYWVEQHELPLPTAAAVPPLPQPGTSHAADLRMAPAAASCRC